MALSVDTTPAKHVTVLRNGDNKYEGRKFVVSKRRYRTFDSLLSDITTQISAPFGAVRRLYTPKGSRQLRSIDDVEGGATYVAGGTERFKRIDYSASKEAIRNWGLNSLHRPGFLADDPPPLVLPRKSRKYAQRSAQFHKIGQPVQFTVFKNGLPSEKGSKFLLKAREMKSYETVLSIISFKIRLVEGAVRKLFTLDGGVIVGADEITDGGQYVAVGHRRFVPGAYGSLEAAGPARVAAPHKLPAVRRFKNPTHASPRTKSNPLPGIANGKPPGNKKSTRSEKDSPAPIKEVEDDEISREEVQVKKKGSPAKYTAEQGVTPDQQDTVFNATGGKPGGGGTEGQFLMDNVNDDKVLDGEEEEEEDEVEEDKNIKEDKPVELQQAEEVVEEEDH